jgi:plasmid stabilization system protein ParE
VTLPVVWIPEANEDLLEARAWYDNVRPVLGERFALAVEKAVEAIAEHPTQFPVVYRGRRRAGVRRFPYGIFFEVQEQRIVVMRASTAGATQGVGKGGNRLVPGNNVSPTQSLLGRLGKYLFITNPPTWRSRQ